MRRNHTGGYSRNIRRGLIILILTCSNLLLNSIIPTPALAAGISPTATRVYGQNGSFTSSDYGLSATAFNRPERIVIDSSGNYYVTDTTNNRVLFFPAGSTTATRVYGQNGSFTTNKGTTSADGLNGVLGVALDSNGNLYISDTGSNRVLFYPSGTTTATRVYGQNGIFTTNTSNNGGLSASSLHGPTDSTVDSSGNLYIADTRNNRVLFFPAGSTTATRVYGQNGSFTTNSANQGGVSASSLNGPTGSAVDSSGNLYIADAANNRVLFFPAGTTTATRVYGQGGSFTTNTANLGGISEVTLNTPLATTLDGSGNLYIADTSNNRVLFFPAGTTTATRVYGQGGSFTTNTANLGGVSAGSFSEPRGVTTDNNGNIVIVDALNNRLLVFQTAMKVTTQPPASSSVGSPFSVVVSVVDVGSNSVFSDFSGTVSVAIKPGSGTSGAALSGTTSVAAVNGVVTFSNLSVNKSGTGYILTVSNPGVKSADTTTFTVSGSLLFIPLTNPSFSFTLNGTTGTVTSHQTFRVSDTTLSSTGWHVTITSTQLTTSGGKTLPTSSVTITQISTACTQGQTCTLPTNTVSGYPLTVPAGTAAPVAITYFRAAGGTGTGDVTLTVTFSLSVPPGTTAGTYTSTVTETLVKGQ